MGSVSELNLTPEGQELIVRTNPCLLLPACLLLRTQILCMSIGVFPRNQHFDHRKDLAFRAMNINKLIMLYNRIRHHSMCLHRISKPRGHFSKSQKVTIALR